MSKDISLLLALSRGPWAIEYFSALGLMPKVEAFLSGEAINFDLRSEQLPSCVALTSTGLTDYPDYDAAPAGSIAVIPVKGPFMKADYCGAPGTATLARLTQQADRHKNISAIIQVIDSPGGQVDGTEHFANVTASTKKPLIAFLDGLCASAAMWNAAGANRIVAGGFSTQIGSIGTMFTMRDTSEIDKKVGVKEHVVRAEKSRDKNEAFYQVQKGNYEPLIKEVLNPLNELFLNHIKTFRPNVPDSMLTGKMYLAAEALEEELIDHIGTFEEAIELALQLSK